MDIKVITKLPSDIDVLVRESELEGFAFVNRLKTEWEEKSNRFDAVGEFLLLATTLDQSVGICGLNIDPYLSDPSFFRLRHLYVLKAYRSRSIGSDLVRTCLENLSSTTKGVRLRVPEKSTGCFYEKLGFKTVEDFTATHIFDYR